MLRLVLAYEELLFITQETFSSNMVSLNVSLMTFFHKQFSHSGNITKVNSDDYAKDGGIGLGQLHPPPDAFDELPRLQWQQMRAQEETVYLNMGCLLI